MGSGSESSKHTVYSNIFAGSIILALLTVSSSVAVAGQASLRSVRGTVVDPEGEPIQAVVQLKDLTSLEIRSYVAHQDGKYRFYELSPDRYYKLRAQHDGVWGPAKTLSAYDSRREATINLKVDMK